MKANLKKFNRLCRQYTYPAVPNSKQELIEFWQAGIDAGKEDPNNIWRLAYISNRMQEDARVSKLYDTYPKLEEMNDELLSFEDVHCLTEDEQADVTVWHKYMDTLIARTKAVIRY